MYSIKYNKSAYCRILYLAAHTLFVTIKKTSEMKYYFILTDGKDAWMQFVYLPTGDYVSGYIRDLRSVGISVHGHGVWTKENRPIAERTLEHVLQRMVAG